MTLAFLLISGCGLLDKRGQNTEKKSGSDSELVSYEEHQQLKQKYDELAKRYSLLQQELTSENSRPQILDDLNSSSSDEAAPDLAETVDVFAKQQQKRESKGSSSKKMTASPQISSQDIDSGLIEEQIQILRKIEERVAQNRFNEALQEIKKIEDSPIRQINVRAKFNLGEVLFAQEEYDLAMQIYEEIIKEDAFSGVVLKTLGRLIVCSENLKLDKKRDTYYSILHDFFQQG